jgi:hypothetical protein
VPLGMVALLVLLTKLPVATRRQREPIDWAGASLILVTFVPLLLALSSGGHAHPWSSLPIVGGFALAALSFVALILVEHGRAHAMLPLSLFRHPVVARCNAALFVLNLGFLGIVLFLPLFVQIVLQAGATASGLVMLPMMAGLIFGSIVAGRIASQTKRYKPTMIVSGFVLLAGMMLLMRVDGGTGKIELGVIMVIIGLGLGPSQSLFTTAIQNAVEREQIGVATSSAQFSRQIGSTLGVAVFGALLTNKLTAAIAANLPGLRLALGNQIDLNLAQRLAMRPDLLRLAVAGKVPAGAIDAIVARDQAALRLAFAESITSLFAIGAMIALVGLVIMFTVPDLRLRGREIGGEQTPLEPTH